MFTTRQKLTEIAELAALLPALAHPSNGQGGAATTRGVAHSPAPARLAILHALDKRLRDLSDDAEDRAWHDRAAGGEHRQGLLPDLYQWAKLIDAEAREDGYQPDELPDELITIVAVIGWLQTWTDWAQEQDFGPAYAADVDWWWRHLRGLAGERDDYVPRCTACHFPITETDGGIWQCAGCQAETSIDAALHRLAEPLVTLSQGVALTGVPRGTLKQWRNDGRLLPIEGRYRLRDIEQLRDTPPPRGRPRTGAI